MIRYTFEQADEWEPSILLGVYESLEALKEDLLKWRDHNRNALKIAISNIPEVFKKLSNENRSILDLARNVESYFPDDCEEPTDKDILYKLNLYDEEGILLSTIPLDRSDAEWAENLYEGSRPVNYAIGYENYATFSVFDQRKYYDHPDLWKEIAEWKIKHNMHELLSELGDRSVMLENMIEEGLIERPDCLIF